MDGPVQDEIEERGNRSPDWMTGWQSLVIVLFLLLAGWQGEELVPTTIRLAGLLVWIATAVAFLITRRVSVIVSFLIVLGFVLRRADFDLISASDVKFVMTEWLSTLLSGQEPYGHYYVTTIPPGSPAAYPPIQFLVHAPGYLLSGLDGVRFTEVALAMAVMGGFAWLGARWGWKAMLPALALYACLPNLVNLSVDGSNETASGAVLLLAVVTAVFAGRRGFAVGPTWLAGISGALAVGMKQPALFVVLGIVVWIGRRAGRAALQRYVLAGAVILIAISIPFLVWDASSYVASLSSFAGFHTEVWGWNVWFLASQFGRVVPDPDTTLVINLAATAAAAIILIAARPQRLSTAVGGGVLVTLVAFVTARWTSYAYFALIAPVVLAIPWLIDLEDRAHSAPPSDGNRLLG